MLIRLKIELHPSDKVNQQWILYCDVGHEWQWKRKIRQLQTNNHQVTWKIEFNLAQALVDHLSRGEMLDFDWTTMSHDLSRHTQCLSSSIRQHHNIIIIICLISLLILWRELYTEMDFIRVKYGDQTDFDITHFWNNECVWPKVLFTNLFLGKK